MDVAKVKKMQAAIRAEAMKGTVEEAISALTGVVAEAILTVDKGSRQKLTDVVGRMVVEYVNQGVRTEKQRVLQVH